MKNLNSISKQDAVTIPKPHKYGWDGDTLAYESTNLYTKHYVYENGSFVPLIQATYRQQINQHQTPQWEHGYDYDKDPLWHTVQKANSFDRVWFYHCDHLGTPQEMSDQTGTIVWTANYKAWGECKTENHTKRDIWDSEIITNNLRFQGQYFDQETGLHYNRFRYYSPYVGRFISKDPIGLLGGLNTFAYAPNPVGWIDPLGLNPRCRYDPNMSKLEKMAHTIHGDLFKPDKSPIGFNMTTIAVAELVDSTGKVQIVAASSAGKLTPQQRITAAGLGIQSINVSKIKGPSGHAERVIINQYAEKNGLIVKDIAASRPICCDCEEAINKHGANPVSPLKPKRI